MKSFASRCLPLLVLALLAGCQSQGPDRVYNAPLDEGIAAMRDLERDLAEGRLEQAATQLQSLRQRYPGDTRLEGYNRQLADAYLARGKTALATGDLDQATQTLSRARSLLPGAPALTQGLDEAIAQARLAQLEAAEAARREAEEAASRAAETQRLARLREEQRQAAASAPVAEPQPVAAPAPRAQLIDPQAPNTSIALPMLDEQDRDALRQLLDAVASDVVTYNCAVRIQVRQAKDFPLVAALLSARVKRLDPAFNPSLIQSLAPDQEPRLILTPVR